jgi:hypothetical protein
VLRRCIPGLALAAVFAAGCSGGAAPTARPTTRPLPDLAAFLRTPVATPTACPSGQTGSSAGRRSPWSGRVDVSVYVDPHAGAGATGTLGRRLGALPEVRQVFAESAAEALAEYQRLYTCSASVSRTDLPPSFRLVLHSLLRARRDQLVVKILRMPSVKTVACDPTDPCTDVVRKQGR